MCILRLSAIEQGNMGLTCTDWDAPTLMQFGPTLMQFGVVHVPAQ